MMISIYEDNGMHARKHVEEWGDEGHLLLLTWLKFHETMSTLRGPRLLVKICQPDAVPIIIIIINIYKYIAEIR